MGGGYYFGGLLFGGRVHPPQSLTPWRKWSIPLPAGNKMSLQQHRDLMSHRGGRGNLKREKRNPKDVKCKGHASDVAACSKEIRTHEWLRSSFLMHRGEFKQRDIVSVEICTQKPYHPWPADRLEIAEMRFFLVIGLLRKHDQCSKPGCSSPCRPAWSPARKKVENDDSSKKKEPNPLTTFEVKFSGGDHPSAQKKSSDRKS